MSLHIICSEFGLKQSKVIESMSWVAVPSSWLMDAMVVVPSSTCRLWSVSCGASRHGCISTVSRRTTICGERAFTHAFWSMQHCLKSFSIMKWFGTMTWVWRQLCSLTRQRVTMPFQNSIGLMNHGFNQECCIKNVLKRVVMRGIKTSRTIWTICL